MNRIWSVLIAMPVAACQGQVAPAPQQEESELLRGCAETQRLLSEMTAAEPSFRYDREGNATMRKALWEAMPAAMQQGLAKAVTYQAVCGSSELREQQVTIRSSENREVLATQVVADFER